jgi:polysaccharide export outer membrane protein
VRQGTQPDGRVPRGIRLGLAAAAAIAAAFALGGCHETDAWWYDPSVVGYWEHTPTRVPIQERIAAIEGPEDDFVEVSEVTAADLIPEMEEYRVGPGDVLDIVIWDLPIAGQFTPYQRIVDTRGFIDIPQLGQLFVNARTAEGVRRVVEEAMKSLVREPLVSVVVSQPQQQQFSVVGAVGASGRYFIPGPDFKLLDALTTARGIQESTPHVYVIRQIPLTDEAAGLGRRAREPVAPEPVPPVGGRELIDVIEGLAEPDGGGSPGMVGGARAASPAPRRQQPQPPVGLVEPEQPARPGRPPETRPEAGSTWVYLNGQWVQVSRPAPAPGQPAVGALTREQLVTQRVIRVPVRPLLAGDARYNLVVRPGDVIRVPAGESGLIYIAGQVSRPGPYSLSPDGKLTLVRAIDAAGGLSALAWPERVDLTRMVGDTTQATIRLNLRAIVEGTHPDVFLKPNDRVNVGTNFIAYPLAVIRNGFRMTYGFGFVLDRNFADDVFGVTVIN